MLALFAKHTRPACRLLPAVCFGVEVFFCGEYSHDAIVSSVASRDGFTAAPYNRGTMETLHVLIHCEACQHPILLHADVLQQPFSNPGELPNRTHAIGIACPNCKTLRRYFLRRSQAEEALEADSPADISGKETVQIGTLSCTESSCQLRLPVFAQWGAATSEQERRVDLWKWRWDGLICPEGHAIKNPYFEESYDELA
jgi:hypothetical protein